MPAALAAESISHNSSAYSSGSPPNVITDSILRFRDFAGGFCGYFTVDMPSACRMTSYEAVFALTGACMCHHEFNSIQISEVLV
jgi:hypothetical protein